MNFIETFESLMDQMQDTVRAMNKKIKDNRAELCKGTITDPALQVEEPDVDALKECIGNLLVKIDEIHKELTVYNSNEFPLHLNGNTPDWYIDAAYLSVYGRKP